MREIAGYWLDVGLIRTNGTCLDIGALGWGWAEEIVAETGCRVVAFEPSPEAEPCPPNDKIIARSEAVASKTGVTAMWFGGDPELACVIGDHVYIELDDCPPTVVNAVSFEDVVLEYGPIDCVKMDIEGGEYDILLNTPIGILQRCRQFAVELHSLHETLEPSSQIAEVCRRMTKAGFDARPHRTQRCDVSGIVEHSWYFARKEDK